MSFPKVTVIIPTFNRAEILKETIRSVLNQTFSDFEIIIVDDGSKDQTKETVESFNDDRIRYVYQENQGRPAPARNVGLKIAKGGYIAFLDDDDLWKPRKLEEQVKILNSMSSIAVVSTNGEYFPKPHMGLLPRKKILNMPLNQIVSFNKLLKSNVIINSSILMRKEVVASVGFLDESPPMRAIEDYDYWLRILFWKDNSIYVLKSSLTLYRIHPANISRDDLEKTEPVHYQELRKLQVIFDKYKDWQPVILHSILKKRERKAEKLTVKESYFHKIINGKRLMQNMKISFWDKIEIVLKVYLSRVIHYLKHE